MKSIVLRLNGKDKCLFAICYVMVVKITKLHLHWHTENNNPRFGLSHKTSEVMQVVNVISILLV